MSIVSAIGRRERGSGMIRDYDVALQRLKCYDDNVYFGITPNVNAPDFNPEPPVFACRFCTASGYEEILALANEAGKIALQNTKVTGKSNEALEGSQAHDNAIFDIAWMPGELKLVTASADHSARLWDVSRPEIEPIACFNAHTQSVKTAVFRHEDKAVFATGARDGSIMMWDIRTDQSTPVNHISNAHSIGNMSNTKRRTVAKVSRAQSITGLAFQDDYTLLSCAESDGLIKVWDLRKNYTIQKKKPIAKHLMDNAGRGFSSLLTCPARITLYASCMDDVVYAYNISSYNPKPVAVYYGHENRMSYYIKTCLSPDGRYLASGSSNELAYIWHTGRPGAPLMKLTGHTKEVTCIAWCNIGEPKIVTCSDDFRHRIWKIGFEHKIENEEVRILGRAEVVENQSCHIASYNSYLRNMKLETTPSSRTSIAYEETTPTSDNETAGRRSENDLRPEDGRTRSSYSVKRTYLQMMGSRSEQKFKSALFPIYENETMLAKRAHLEHRGARRLFGSNTEIASSSNKDYDSDEPGTSETTSASDDRIPFSFMSNLPNFVIDGTAPHLVEVSPEKHEDNFDWLAKMRKQRCDQKKAASCSPKTHATPRRRSKKLLSTESQRGTLLNLFNKVASKECDNPEEPSTSFANQSASTSRDDRIPSSSTSNLPSLMNGLTAHVPEVSPQKHKDNVVWLTKMRKERCEQHKVVSGSPKSQVTPSRRSRKSRSTESQKVTLLNFFSKASSKENSEEPGTSLTNRPLSASRDGEMRSSPTSSCVIDGTALHLLEISEKNSCTANDSIVSNPETKQCQEEKRH